ncbi:MAG: beta-propeller domain-containing protein [Syntrophomonas sp.]
MSTEARKSRFFACIAVSLMLILFASSLVWGLSSIASTQPLVKKPVTPLPVVGTMDNFKKLLTQVSNGVDEGLAAGFGADVRIMNQSKTMMPSAAMEMAKSDSSPTTASSAVNYSAAAGDYSATNVQVQGVDEADIIKTDGHYIYQVGPQKINIIKALPPSKMELVSKLSFEDQNFSPQELYLDSKNLVVVGSSHTETVSAYNPGINTEIYPPPYRHISTTKVLVYDISNKANIKKSREIELDGDYLSSRKIGSAVYLVSNQHIPYYASQNQDILLPGYRDSAAGNTANAISCDQIRYFPDCVYPAYILTAGFDLDRNQEKVDVKSYLGNGENLYASTGNLYVVMRQYEQQQPEIMKSNVSSVMVPATAQSTIYRFALGQGKIEYSGKGEVPGTIINQFSMDEDQGYFRIATTTGEVWREDQYTSKNHVYVLDGDLNITGRLENIAPGEKIYSTRFMGSRLYMVTFKKVDPLFVIDLKNPSKPALLGKLKIPGYSDYLHPYDETHLIGFGKESIELKIGNNDESQAFYQGMKIALFDVSDVNNPKQISQTLIGDRGTDSEVLHNHKALLFSREQNLMAFPVTVMEVGSQSKIDEYGYPRYGSFAFQGAYVYNLNLADGFQLKGRISHLEAADYQKAGDSRFESGKNVERIIYIGNTFYTLSQGTIKANQTSVLKEFGKLAL